MRSKLERAAVRASVVGCASAIVACAAQVAGPAIASARPDAPRPHAQVSSATESAQAAPAPRERPLAHGEDPDLVALERAAAAVLSEHCDPVELECGADPVEPSAESSAEPMCYVVPPPDAEPASLTAAAQDPEAESLATAASSIDGAPTPAATEGNAETEGDALAIDPSSCASIPEMSLAAPTPIEDPSGAALRSFHDALRRARDGEGQARIVFYGASHVASDLFTGIVRRRLQQAFGNAGPGFFLPGRPWRFYRHEGLRFERTRGLRTRRIKASRPGPDAYGLAGVALDSFSDRPASAAFEIESSALRAGEPAELELYYAQRSNGGTVRLFADGVLLARISTAGRGSHTGYARAALPLGARRIELRTDGDGPVRVYGASLEHAGSGVVLDTLGIPGSRARYHLLWDDALYREHLARRKADLVVLAYGTNESGDDLPMEQYEADLRQALLRVREVAPQASCLLVGPSDRPLRPQPGVYRHRQRTSLIVEAQRRVSAEVGCGFFDLVGFMGGPLSMARWVNAQPPLGTPDHVHFTRAGYERLGHALHDALLAGSGLVSEALPANATAQRAQEREAK